MYSVRFFDRCTHACYCTRGWGRQVDIIYRQAQQLDESHQLTWLAVFFFSYYGIQDLTVFTPYQIQPLVSSVRGSLAGLWSASGTEKRYVVRPQGQYA